MTVPPPGGRLLPVHDTRLFVAERGPEDGLPLLVLHGGPGPDHAAFCGSLDPLADTYRLVLVDGRAQGRSDRDSDPRSWTLEQHASDVSAVAAAIGAERYAVLGHASGALVALQHAVDAPGAAVATVVSSGVPSTSRLSAAEASGEQATWLEGGGHAIEVADRLPEVAQPVLVLTGRQDRTCVPAAAQAMVAALPRADLHVFEDAGQRTWAEQPEDYVAVVRAFLDRVAAEGARQGSGPA